MISHKHKCIFIHIPKTAGISIEKKFLRLLGLNYEDRLPLLLTPNKQPAIGPPRLAHLSLNELTQHHYISNEIAHTYFKFTFVRHPVDRIVSIYRYRNYCYICNFDTFVFKALPRLFESDWFFRPQVDFLKNHKGIIDMDFVGRFENIDEDFEKICNILKIKDTKLFHHNKNIIELSLIRKIYRILKLTKDDPKAVNLLFFRHKATKGETIISNKSKEIIRRLYNADFKSFHYK